MAGIIRYRGCTCRRMAWAPEGVVRPRHKRSRQLEGEQHRDRFRDRKRDKDTSIEKGRVRASSPDK